MWLKDTKMLDTPVLERREGRKKERERNIHWLSLAHTLTGDQTHNPGMVPEGELNPQPFGLQDDAQLTEAHQPGQE